MNGTATHNGRVFDGSLGLLQKRLVLDQEGFHRCLSFRAEVLDSFIGHSATSIDVRVLHLGGQMALDDTHGLGSAPGTDCCGGGIHFAIVALEVIELRADESIASF